MLNSEAYILFYSRLPSAQPTRPLIGQPSSNKHATSQKSMNQHMNGFLQHSKDSSLPSGTSNLSLTVL